MATNKTRFTIKKTGRQSTSFLNNDLNSSDSSVVDSSNEEYQSKSFPKKKEISFSTHHTGFESYYYVPNDAIDYDDILDQDYEGFEYDTCQNDIFNTELELKGKRALLIAPLRYFILFLIGVFTGLTAAFIDFMIETITRIKFDFLTKMLRTYNQRYEILYPIFAWCCINASLIFIGSLIVVFISPVASGSGIPQVKCFLNGINVPKLLRLSTMLVKGVGVMLSVCGGLAVGKEGPMIHVGSVIAGGLSQGRFTYFRKTLKTFRVFRTHIEKRDFVSAGAAAGVAAAFGAPVGGLLFALEEGASFVSPLIMWRILFASVTSMFNFSFFKMAFRGSTFKFIPGGIISFGTFTFLESYNILEIIIFILFGAFGGLTGALFIKCNEKLTKFRKKYVTFKLCNVFEACIITCITTSIGYGLMWAIEDCHPAADTGALYPLTLMCADNEFNSVSSLFFSTPERSVQTLFHDPYLTYKPIVLIIYTPIYFIIAFLTYGLSVSSGLFIPCLLIGAAWGRVFGTLLHWLSSDLFPVPGKFALIGAAAQLGGIVRMTVSLTVILMEATGSVLVGLPILITLFVAKYTGDYFTEGIYDIHIGLSGMALLNWEADALAVTKKAYDVMSSPVVYLNSVMRLGDLLDRLNSTGLHNAYPVVEGHVRPDKFQYGILVGMISSEHLSLLLKHKIFMDTVGTNTRKLTISEFDEAYPHFHKLSDMIDTIEDDERALLIDLRPYMNEAPFKVPETMTMVRTHHLFRSLGLRHLPVVDANNHVRGIITRKDLRRFKFESKGQSVHVDEMVFSRNVEI